MSTIGMPFDTDAYLADTTNLSTIEHGAYLLILMTLWRSKTGWVDGSDTYLARATRMTVGRWKRVAQAVRGLLVTDEKGRVSQKRILKERRKSQLSPQVESLGENPNLEAKPLKNKEPILEKPDPARNPPIPLLLTEEVKKVESPKKKSKGSVIPENWTPRANERDYGRKIGLSDVEIDRGAEQIKRWSMANAHREVARKSNWDMAFRNWLDGMIERRAKQRGSHEENRGSSSRRSFAGYAAELRYGAAGSAADGLAGDREPFDRRGDPAQRLV